MRTYGENSKGAVLRVLVMANIVDRKLDEAQLGRLRDLMQEQDMDLEAVLRVVSEYELDAAAARSAGSEFFNGDPMLPRGLVEHAFSEISGMMTLQVAQMMHHLLTTDRVHTHEQVLFVEMAVGFWGLGPVWRAWLQGGVVTAGEPVASSQA